MSKPGARGDAHETGAARSAAATGRFIAGDPLRALAALGVLLFHAIIAALLVGAPTEQPGGQPAARVAEFLRLGLYVFFVLSGYLLSRPFVRGFVESIGRPPIGAYLRNRALRIVPAFWVAVTLTIVAFGTLGASGRQIAALYGFAQEVEPSALSSRILQGWSVGVEVCFYLLLPLAAGTVALLGADLGRRRRLAALWSLQAAAFVGSLGFQIVTGGLIGDAGWQRSLPAMLFAFVPGVALAVVELSVTAWLRAHSRRSAGIAAGILAAALLAGVAHVVVVLTAPLWLISALAALAAGGLVAAALVRQWATGGAWRALDNAPMRWLGARSYGIYVFHFGVLAFIAERLGGMSSTEAGLILVPAGLVITPLLAALSYRFVERPFLRLRHRWRRPAAPAPMVPLPSVPAHPAAVAPPPAPRGA